MFEDLVGLTLDEYEIFKLVCTEARENFESFDETYYFFQLEPQPQFGVTRVKEIKKFTAETYCDFYDSLEYSPICILFKIECGVAEGHLLGSFYDATNKMNSSRTLRNQVEKFDSEMKPFLLPPKELIEKAFAEMTDQLRAVKRPKAM